ncbi:uncharacterized protein LOC130700143 [Daphnia carinata]|uniref:uncharacterized protein LOC130700143 n=1 Tax=Daphnia carinata TaxID=120202 RepID=UPI00257AEC21|nr:uncharacterized protein LOC130700143 [Daphnia carinata]
MANVSLYLFVLISTVSIVECQQLDDEQEQAVTMFPNDEIVVRHDQHLMLTCRIKGAQVTRCLWEINGAAPSDVLDMAFENRMHQSQRYGKCHILMKVTERNIGQWTCCMFTDLSDIPKNATTQVSLFHRTSSPIGLVTIIIVGLMILLSYASGYILQNTYQSNVQRWKGISQMARPTATASTTVRGMNSQESLQCEDSAYYNGDIEMSPSLNPAKDHH